MRGIVEKTPDARALARLFRACFPGIVRKASAAEAIFSHPGNRLLACQQDGAEAGVILWNGNVVLMLCVLPQYRGQGIGSALLEALEARLARAGAGEIRFCDGFSYLAPGIPIGEGEPAYARNRAFFEKRGYRHSWGTEECVDMAMSLSDFRDDGHRVGDEIRGVKYRFAGKEDMRRVLECTDDGYPEFSPYYRNPSLYAGSPANGERVLIAETDGLVAGTLMVCFETEQPGLGSVGCTVTRPAYRNRGIATTMVRLGTGEFRARGIPNAYLGYTYTQIVPMYARSGYSVSMRYFMGVKTLQKGSQNEGRMPHL